MCQHLWVPTSLLQSISVPSSLGHHSGLGASVQLLHPVVEKLNSCTYTPHTCTCKQDHLSNLQLFSRFSRLGASIQLLHPVTENSCTPPPLTPYKQDHPSNLLVFFRYIREVEEFSFKIKFGLSYTLSLLNFPNTALQMVPMFNVQWGKIKWNRTVLNYLITHTHTFNVHQPVPCWFTSRPHLSKYRWCFWDWSIHFPRYRCCCHGNDTCIQVAFFWNNEAASHIISHAFLLHHEGQTLAAQVLCGIKANQMWNQDKHKPCRTSPTWNQGKPNVEFEQTQCGIDKPFVKNK